MIAVILDSNSMYGDPFLKTGFLNRLIAYSSLDKLDILISDVVIEEVVNNNRNRVLVTYEKVKGQLKTINDVVGTQSIVVNEVNVDTSESELRARYEDLKEKGAIITVPYTNDLLPELINRAVKKIKPFKEKKEEFRDSVIWLSCINYLKENNYECSFFITNNTSDFSSTSDKSKLHPDLENDFDNIQLYTTIKDFFESEKERLSRLIPNETSANLLNWVSKQEFSNEYIKTLMRDNFFKDIENSISQLLSGINVHEINPDVFDGYVQPYNLDDFWLEDYEVVIDVDRVIVTGQCMTSDYVEVYQYNPVYDDSDEKFSFAGESETEVDMEFIFSLSPDKDDPYDFDITKAKVQVA